MIDKFALIIGAMKSGTSSLFWYLAEHPAIARCSDKEPHFLAHEDDYLDLERYESLWDWEPDEHEWELEASTSSTKRPAYPDVAERLAEVRSRHDREFKFVYCLRDPLDRIESHRAHNLLNRRWRECRHISDTPHVVETTRYAAQFDEWPAPIRASYRLLLQKKCPSPELTDTEREWIEFTLRRDIERLKDDYGFDTSGWSISA